MVRPLRSEILLLTGMGVLLLSFLSEILILHRSLSNQQRLETERALNLIEGRLAGYLELLSLLPQIPEYLQGLAWLTDELQGDPGLVGVLVKEGSRILLNTFPEGNFPLSEKRCYQGYEAEQIFFLCRETELAPGRKFFLLVAFDAAFKRILFREAVIYGGLVFLGGALLLLLATLYSLKLEKERETLRRKLEASERLAAMGRLAAMIAHEIRNPLNTLSMGWQYLREGARFEEIDPLLREEMHRLSELTEELLALYRGFEIHPEEFEVQDLARQLEARFRPKVEARQQSFHLHFPEKAVLKADRRWLYRAIENLLLNALEHTPEGGEIHLTFQETSSGWKIEVCNTGSSVPSELRERIFEPFFTGRKGGFGLGLYIVKEVAEAHGGRVKVTSSGEKTCFILEIPS